MRVQLAVLDWVSWCKMGEGGATVTSGLQILLNLSLIIERECWPRSTLDDV